MMQGGSYKSSVSDTQGNRSLEFFSFFPLDGGDSRRDGTLQ